MPSTIYTPGSSLQCDSTNGEPPTILCDKITGDKDDDGSDTRTTITMNNDTNNDANNNKTKTTVHPASQSPASEPNSKGRKRKIPSSDPETEIEIEIEQTQDVEREQIITEIDRDKNTDSSSALTSAKIHTENININRGNSSNQPNTASTSTSTSAQAPIKRQKISWEERIQALAKFKSEHNHLNVSQRGKGAEASLGKFVKKMREYKKNTDEGKKGKGIGLLSKERIQQLDDMGFVWRLRDSNDVISFDGRLAQLQEFKAKLGHVDVPRVYKDNVSLGRWCHVIRQSYQKVKEQKKAPYKISQEEITRLEEMGFQWRKTNFVKRNVKQKTFAERMQELKDFKKEHGHLRVTYGMNKNLAIFCGHMRTARRHPDRVNRIKLTEERIQALDSVGFEWEPMESERSAKKVASEAKARFKANTKKAKSSKAKASAKNNSKSKSKSKSKSGSKKSSNESTFDV